MRVTQAFQMEPQEVQTADNGKEFADHREFAQVTGMKSFLGGIQLCYSGIIHVWVCFLIRLCHNKWLIFDEK